MASEGYPRICAKLCDLLLFEENKALLAADGVTRIATPLEFAQGGAKAFFLQKQVSPEKGKPLARESYVLGEQVRKEDTALGYYFKRRGVYGC